MGREIRRVPPGWQHPKDSRGEYVPLYGGSYRQAAQEWLGDCIAWEAGTHSAILEDPTVKQKYPFYWEWADTPPNEEYYRPDWPEETRTAYQIYENVSGGTPVSPVFVDQDAMLLSLRAQGHSKKAARAFITSGYAPSFALNNTGVMASNIDIFDMP